MNLSEYEKIVREFSQPLYNYCFYRMNYNKALAEETLDDVMQILYTKWDTLDIGKNIRAWLYRVADKCIKHNLTNYYKYYSHTESLDDAIENNRFDEPAQCDNYFSLDFSEEEYIEKIMNSLPDEYKEIFRLRYIDKRTISETASLVGIPYSSLYLRLTKIEKTVRKEIKKILISFEKIRYFNNYPSLHIRGDYNDLDK